MEGTAMTALDTNVAVRLLMQDDEEGQYCTRIRPKLPNVRRRRRVMQRGLFAL
jgi:hypothetical protein